MFRAIIRSENKTVFCLCIILLAGMGMSVLFDYDLACAVDQKSYWSMAQLDFQTSPHRRYRFVIPLLAGGLNAVIRWPVQLLRPGALSGDFSLKLSFFIVNLLIAAAWCTLIFRYCRAYGLSMMASLTGLLAVVTSRWSAQYVGTPHTDLLFCLAIVSALYGIKTRDDRFLWVAILLGPVSKESFLFAAPILFWSHWTAWKTALALLLSGALAFLSRYLIDISIAQTIDQSIRADLNILRYIPSQLARLKVTGYWIELFASFGLWWMLPLAERLLIGRMPATAAYLKQPYVIVFLLTSAFQIVLNGEYARMVYMLMPVYALIIAIAASRLHNLFLRETGRGPFSRG